MTSKHLFSITLACAALAGSSMAFAADTKEAAPAKHAGTRQNHHCKLADGTMDMAKNKKACLAAKGSWAKDAPAGDAPGAAMPAASAAAKK